MHICVNVYPARPSVIIVRSAKVMARFGASSSLTSASEYMQYTPCAQMAMVMALPQIEPTTQNADGRLRTPAPRLERIKCIAAIQAEMPCTAEGVAAASGASVFIGVATQNPIRNGSTTSRYSHASRGFSPAESTRASARLRQTPEVNQK